jgi:hypothetical protein
MPQQSRETHAVVIGGSLGGLLAARVLAAFAAAGEHRKGVPQGRHTHGLLASGSRVLKKWFPGFSQEVIEAGAVAGDIVADSRWFMEGACLKRFKSGLDGLLMTRPFLEGRIRQRVLAPSNVQARQNFRADGLTVSRDGRRVNRRQGRRH